MVIFVDIDGTICLTDGDLYKEAVPLQHEIDKINRYYEDGHYIVYWTSRGATTGIDWRDLTERQLEEWGVQYHELRLDKPFYDVLIDDKAFEKIV